MGVMDGVIGLISANYATEQLGSLTGQRTIASLPFGSRYRLIDFPLSNMVNAGITTVGLVTPYRYRSIFDHIGAGGDWGLDRKVGGLFVLPGSVFGVSTSGSRFLLRDVARNIVYLNRTPAPYVLVASSNVVSNTDYRAMAEAHLASGADITLAYNEAVEDEPDMTGLKTENGRVLGVTRGVKRGQEAFLDCFIIGRGLLLKIVEWYSAINYLDLFEGLAGDYDKMDVRTYQVEGYARSIYTTQAYYARSMDLLDEKVNTELFNKEAPIMTKIQDSVPTKYLAGGRTKNSLIPAGCIIEGSVENSILFRGVKVGRGAVIKNSIIMQSCTIENGAVVENAILDRSNLISAGTVIKGSVEAIFIKEKNYS